MRRVPVANQTIGGSAMPSRVTPKNRSFLKYVAVILFVLAAIFLFAVKSISTNTDLGLIALGLAVWALA